MYSKNLLFTLCALSAALSQAKPRYADPDVFAVNRLPAQAFGADKLQCEN